MLLSCQKSDFFGKLHFEIYVVSQPLVAEAKISDSFTTRNTGLVTQEKFIRGSRISVMVVVVENQKATKSHGEDRAITPLMDTSGPFNCEQYQKLKILISETE